MFFTKRNRAYLDNYEQEKLKFSLKAQRVIDTIERESGQKVKVVVDPEFTESFRFFMGISYRWWGMFGKYIVVSDPKTLEDEEFLRHEAIHCAQQRDLWFIRRLAISFTSLGLKFLKVKELDEAMDFWTDNQVTDYESYLNQFNKGYLKTRKPGDRKKYRNAEFRKQEMNRFKEEEIDTLIDKLEELEKDYLPAATTDVEKKEIELEIEKMKSDIDQYTHVYEELKKMDEVLVVMIKPDIQGNKKEDTREQVYFESKANREKRLPVEKFIQKYGKKEDNYKQWVEYYIEYKNLLDKFNETSTLGEKEKKDVAKRFLEYIKVKSPENMKKFFEDNKEFLDEHSIKESE